MVLIQDGMGHLLFFFLSRTLALFLFSSFFNTFILHSHIPPSVTRKYWERLLKELRAIIPTKTLFVFPPSVGVEHFFSGWKGMFVRIPSVGMANICGCT